MPHPHGVVAESTMDAGGPTMDYRITQDDRARFKRCRRQWDFASPHRRGLEPVGLADSALDTALKDALTVYYYPGTWDWPHELTQSLVHKAAERALDDARAADRLQTATRLLDAYDDWARTVDDFAPVKIEHEVQGLVPDPREPDRGLVTADGSPVIYTGRIDLLAVDAADEYWVVRHHIVAEWRELDALIRDEAAVAGCWAWEQEYLGMEIAGTIHNELCVTAALDPPPANRSAARRVGQSEASGGGRAIPQHRRLLARTARTDETNRVKQCTAGLLRRTHIRRSREEISAVGVLIGAEAIDMTSNPAIYPTYAPHCQTCEFASPCSALTEGRDPAPILTQSFRAHRPDDQRKPRLGQSTWGFGRGAAPPQW
jgi:hypothetical protein